jgi:imidazolonepropionase-like amidohydrolase
MRNKITILFAVLATASSLALSGPAQDKVIAITGAKIVPVVGNDIPNGTILIRGGRIEAVGAGVAVPAGAEVVDASGLIAYPGMIDSYCELGLNEISGVAATVDTRETGRINPQVRALEAIRYDSMHIPISRSNGITAALVAPSGGVISGQSCLLKLDGWTNREMLVKSPAAMHFEFPAIRGGRGGFGGRGGGQERAGTPQIIAELKALFADARAYEKRRDAAEKNALLPLPEYNETYEELLPLLRGEVLAMISVHSDTDVKAVIKFVQEEKLKAVFYGVEQGWKVADEIKAAGIPVVLDSLYGMPPVFEDGYDSIFRNAGVLNKAGVKIAFSSSSSSTAKDLPYMAAKAAAFGLDKKEALKAVTIYPAEIFGLGETMGSLEKGKVANIVLADDDILELRTNVVKVYIDGKETDLSNRYTELLEKFKKRKSEIK